MPHWIPSSCTRCTCVDNQEEGGPGGVPKALIALASFAIVMWSVSFILDSRSGGSHRRQFIIANSRRSI